MVVGTRNIEVEMTDNGLWVAGSSGRARLAQIGDTVVRIDLEGHAYHEFAEAMRATMDSLARSQGRLYLGIDAEGMNSYDGRFRYLWTEWIKANRESIDGLLILFRNRAVEGVAVIINAVTGGDVIEACDDRDEFEDRLAAAVSGSRPVAVQG
jgi:hypothetical protein